MTTTRKLLSLAVLSLAVLTGCSSDDDFNSQNPDPEVPQGNYDNGIFVVNEGTANSLGTITYMSDDLTSVEQSIYQEVNGGDLGLYVQSMFFDGDLAYIIANGSNLITVVNRYTFEEVAVIDSGLEIPYYGVVENGKAYVTNLVSFESGDDDYIAVINLDTYEVENTILVGNYASKIKEEDDMLFIENINYGAGESVTVFNPATEQVASVINTTGINSFEVEGNTLYALSATSLKQFDVTTGNETASLALTYGTAENPLSPQNLVIEDGQVYFTVEKSVYQMPINATEAPTEALLSYSSDSQDFAVMYGFEVEDDRIYIADGGDFQSNSFVEVYDLNGNLLQSTEVGVGPNGFYFND